MDTPAPLLIALPQGLNVSGVTLWALRLSRAMAERGRHCGLILHPEPDGQRPITSRLPRGVKVFDLRDLPPIQKCGGDLSAYIPRYLDALETMARRGTVVMCPNLHGDCYGACAALALARPDILRVVGWQHSDIAYDTRMLAHYAPMLHRFIGVSDVIERSLKKELGARARDVMNIPYGVETPDEPHTRAPLQGRPVRLLYTGRIEHEQKRVRALIAMSDTLAIAGIDHRLTLLGDGPASEEIDKACEHRPEIRRIRPGGQGTVRRYLASHDAFVLASRYEGLSVSMLEAMAHGCVPIVTGVRSGAAQAISDGDNGLLADAGENDDETTTGRAMAEEVRRMLDSHPARLSERAWLTVRERFSIDLHAERASKLFDRIAAEPARSWPAARPCAFSAGAGSQAASGSVPEEGPKLLRDLLATLRGQTIVLHGAGRHTIELASVLADAPVEIAAIADDDPNRHGQTLLGWPIIAPSMVKETGAAGVVISSWMHQDTIYERCSPIYSHAGLRTWRVYPARSPSGVNAA